MACAAVLAGIRLAIVDVQFAVLALEAFRAIAGIGADEVFAFGAVLARIRFTFVDFYLAIRSGVAFLAVTSVGITDGLAGAVVA